MGNNVLRKKPPTTATPLKRVRTIDTRLEPIEEVQELSSPCDRDHSLRRATSIGNASHFSEAVTALSARQGTASRRPQRRILAQPRQRRLIRIVGPARVAFNGVLLDLRKDPAHKPAVKGQDCTSETDQTSAQENTRSTSCESAPKHSSSSVAYVSQSAAVQKQRTGTYGQLARQVRCTQIFMASVPKRDTETPITPVPPQTEPPPSGRRLHSKIVRLAKPSPMRRTATLPSQLQIFPPDTPKTDGALTSRAGNNRDPSEPIKPLSEKRGWHIRLQVHPAPACREQRGSDDKRQNSRPRLLRIARAIQ